MTDTSFKDTVRPKKHSPIELPPPLTIIEMPAGSPIKPPSHNPFEDFLSKAASGDMEDILKQLSSKNSE